MMRSEEPIKRILIPSIILEDVLEGLVNVLGCRKYVEDTVDDYKILTLICRSEKDMENALMVINSILDKHPIVKELYDVVIK